jgi:hypothetical protein
MRVCTPQEMDTFTFASEPHFSWYHKEKEALQQIRWNTVKRKDRFCNPIGRAIGRMQKVTFRDTITSGEQALTTVFTVESYKEYNVIDDKKQLASTKDKNGNCSCLTF